MKLIPAFDWSITVSPGVSCTGRQRTNVALCFPHGQSALNRGSRTYACRENRRIFRCAYLCWHTPSRAKASRPPLTRNGMLVDGSGGAEPFPEPGRALHRPPVICHTVGTISFSTKKKRKWHFLCVALWPRTDASGRCKDGAWRTASKATPRRAVRLSHIIARSAHRLQHRMHLTCMSWPLTRSASAACCTVVDPF
jgi:hypothetical protein